jgi:hypothetical protein
MKLLFAPLRMITSRLAGAAGNRIVGRVWNVVDGGARPRPEQRSARWPRLLAALALEGAVFAAVRGAADHACRRWFARLTGRWPGEGGAERD